MPRDSHNIVLVGAGNVAYHLGRALKQSENKLLMIIDRTEQKAQRLAFEFGCQYSSDFSAIPDETDIVIIAVKDDAISTVAKQILCPGKIVAHTSGAVPMEALGDCSDRLGVFYPLQTLHRDSTVAMRNVPFCIEGNSKWNEGMLLELASSISDNVQLVNSAQRKVVHMAAVFACNFSNHCFAMADEILGKANIPLDILKPLIQQTVVGIATNRPADVQTGPAKRGDTQVMQNHMDMLAQMSPELVPIYKAMSDSISKTN
jgi:predicted short-subunit dehydrogenase-like oxidoreductase (DUF2520 family)